MLIQFLAEDNDPPFCSCMPINLSVITCAHNSRQDYLAQVTNALKTQTLDKHCWEYLLVDNASTEPLSSRIDLSWHPSARHITEEKLGLTPARLRGIQEAAGEILVFVDDDNVLDPDYLEQVLRLAAAWPILGAFGGQARPSFEQDPPEWTQKYWRRLAIWEFDNDRWSNIPCFEDTTPNGAGLCVRQRVATEYLAYHANHKRRFILDRSGTNLRERLEESYLLRLTEAQTFSGVVLMSFRSVSGAQTRLGWKTIVADQVRMLFMEPQERRFFRAARRGQKNGFEFLSTYSNGLIP